MPECIVCKKTPVTLLVQEYSQTGRYWYFCSPDHLKEWLEEQEDIATYGIKNKEKLYSWDWETEEDEEAIRPYYGKE